MKVNSKTLAALRGALRELPGLEIISTGSSHAEEQLVLRIAAKGAKKHLYKLTAVWVQEGWPNDVKQAIATIPHPWPRNWIVAARCFSVGALEQLEKRDANWVDEAGNVRLYVPPGLVVLKKANERKGQKAPRFAWSSSSVAVAEFLLAGRPAKMMVGDLAQQTGWSAPQISNVLNAFDKKEWTARHGPARGKDVWRELANPGTLLDSWSAHLFENRPKRFLGHRILRDPIGFLRDDLARVLDKFGEWAVTGWAGLEIVAPHISIVPTLQVYLPQNRFLEEPPVIFKAAGIREVEDGANIEIWEMNTSLLAKRREPGNIPVVNLLRLYADLLSIGGRAKEGAEHLRETQIGI
jgi:hypothetical protein